MGEGPSGTQHTGRWEGLVEGGSGWRRGRNGPFRGVFDSGGAVLHARCLCKRVNGPLAKQCTPELHPSKDPLLDLLKGVLWISVGLGFPAFKVV